ncbi:hypothetical protein BB560_003338 [Smittium megazygosporum]|uniref:Uncharacterized protein n=1 Tax=Smittium megazygosporum TaxID=133381 RepID=A0A2T9ZCC6_9FUNG|nr:hypothetical protein BB560_003338 [Smittium megazygosporum]
MNFNNSGSHHNRSSQSTFFVTNHNFSSSTNRFNSSHQKETEEIPGFQENTEYPGHPKYATLPISASRKHIYKGILNSEKPYDNPIYDYSSPNYTLHNHQTITTAFEEFTSNTTKFPQLSHISSVSSFIPIEKQFNRIDTASENTLNTSNTTKRSISVGSESKPKPETRSSKFGFKFPKFGFSKFGISLKSLKKKDKSHMSHQSQGKKIHPSQHVESHTQYEKTKNPNLYNTLPLAAKKTAYTHTSVLFNSSRKENSDDESTYQNTNTTNPKFGNANANETTEIKDRSEYNGYNIYLDNYLDCDNSSYNNHYLDSSSHSVPKKYCMSNHSFDSLADDEPAIILECQRIITNIESNKSVLEPRTKSQKQNLSAYLSEIYKKYDLLRSQNEVLKQKLLSSREHNKVMIDDLLFLIESKDDEIFELELKLDDLP